MDELKEKLAALGISTDQIDGVLETVLGFVKEKLPDSMGGMVDSIMNGEDVDTDGIMGSAMDAVKGMFGGKD